MPNVFHVGAYLVRSSRFQDTFYERYIAEAFQYAIMCNGAFAYLTVGWKHVHAQPVPRVSSDIALNAPFILVEVAPYQGIVAAVSGLVEEL
ncbi:Uncharacterised protein [Chlamydia trachomatis]|nr:Uncharacterised protein [Chlamydia trachomatis]